MKNQEEVGKVYERFNRFYYQSAAHALNWRKHDMEYPIAYSKKHEQPDIAHHAKILQLAALQSRLAAYIRLAHYIMYLFCDFFDSLESYVTNLS